MEADAWELLGAVDWSALRTAHGTASHVPAAIRGMASGNAEERETNYWRLDNHVVLQGDLFEAALFVARALILLSSSNAEWPGRRWMYVLLWELRNGSSRPDDLVELSSGVLVPLDEACRGTIDDAFRSFLPDCLSADPKLRRAALDLISTIEPHTPQIRGFLEQARSRTRDADARRDLEDALRDMR